MEELKKILHLQFPTLTDEGLIDEIVQTGHVQSVDKETMLIRMNQYVKFIPLVTKGAIKVMRENDDGSEIFLYYLYPGQTCAFTLNCCLSEAPSEVNAIAEPGTEYLSIPRNSLSRWLGEYNSWRQFILQMYSDRFNALLEAVDTIAFQQLDERLVSYLTDKAIASGNPEISITHQQIADDLHSSREVISRLLKKLEKLGKIKTGRNRLTIEL